MVSVGFGHVDWNETMRNREEQHRDLQLQIRIRRPELGIDQGYSKSFFREANLNRHSPDPGRIVTRYVHVAVRRHIDMVVQNRI
ncbi:hypothetical protein VTI28DRAFT_198 [Corynascus sepedonium]